MENKDFVEVDFGRVLGAIWAKRWQILLVGVAGALIAFGVVSLFVPKTYRADIKISVNNSASLSDLATSISSGEISASQNLVSTYIVILQSRTVLGQIRDVIAEEGLTYTRGQLSGMISASSMSKTQILKVSVTAKDKTDAKVIANAVAEVLPGEVSRVLKGTSVVILDKAVEGSQAGPDVTKYTVLGFLAGIALTGLIIGVCEIFNDKIRDEAILGQMFETIPILANIPHKDHVGYGGRYSYEYNRSYGYEYGTGDKGKTV